MLQHGLDFVFKNNSFAAFVRSQMMVQKFNVKMTIVTKQMIKLGIIQTIKTCQITLKLFLWFV